MSLKSHYVAVNRAARNGLQSTGMLTALDRWAAHSKAGTWARSLLSIYDIDELAALDVPWWTFESAALADAFLMGRRSARAFEWGSGASTIWLARRCASVTSVEHDRQWGEALRQLLPDPAVVDLHVVVGAPATGAPGEVRSQKKGATGLDFGDYVGALERTDGDFDIIVIDGRAREACLPPALARLAPDGLLVFDNVERKRYRDAIAAAGDAIDTTWTMGLTPGLPYPTRTALLRRKA